MTEIYQGDLEHSSLHENFPIFWIFSFSSEETKSTLHFRDLRQVCSHSLEVSIIRHGHPELHVLWALQILKLWTVIAVGFQMKFFLNVKRGLSNKNCFLAHLYKFSAWCRGSGSRRFQGSTRTWRGRWRRRPRWPLWRYQGTGRFPGLGHPWLISNYQASFTWRAKAALEVQKVFTPPKRVMLLLLRSYLFHWSVHSPATHRWTLLSRDSRFSSLVFPPHSVLVPMPVHTSKSESKSALNQFFSIFYWPPLFRFSRGKTSCGGLKIGLNNLRLGVQEKDFNLERATFNASQINISYSRHVRKGASAIKKMQLYLRQFLNYLSFAKFRKPPPHR